MREQRTFQKVAVALGKCSRIRSVSVPSVPSGATSFDAELFREPVESQFPRWRWPGPLREFLVSDCVTFTTTGEATVGQLSPGTGVLGFADELFARRCVLHEFHCVAVRITHPDLEGVVEP